MATPSKNSGFVDNWQAGKTVTECNLHMLTSEDFTDVIFRVGSEKHVIRAHRYALVSRSCVFHAMFCSPLAEKGEVTIPDIEPDIFRQFLRYVYTDTLRITAENVAGLLYTSSKYAVDGLQAKCSSYLEQSLSEENVCQILEQCHGYGELDLEQTALKMLTRAGMRVIESPGFPDLCSDCLRIFLKSERLKLKEEEIFEATLSWAKNQCQNRNILVNNENIQSIIGDMRYEIRFASMSLDYLVNAVGTEILSESERNRILNYKSLRTVADISPFKSSQRRKTQATSPEASLPCRYAQRFQSDGVYYNSPGTHAISFSATRNIHLVGCQLYGPCWLSQARFSISAKLMNSAGNVVLEPFSNKLKILHGNNHLNDLLFPSAFTLEAGSKCTLCITITGSKTLGGGDGQQSVKVDGVTFTFTDSPYSTAGTEVTVGQIPGLIFRPMQ